MKSIQRWVAVGMGLLLLYTLALGARRAVLEAQYARLGDDLPFTLESALYYRRVKMVYDTGTLPRRDISIQFPEGLDVRRTYTVGSEYVFAALARLWPDSVPVPNRIRWIESGWFCLAVPLLALGLFGATRSWWGAGVGASFYAVAISSVMRSTGQELSHENFALPFLVAHWAADMAGRRTLGTWSGRLGLLGSAFFLGLALCAWDLVQFYIALRFLCATADAVRGRMPWGSREGWRHAAELFALMLVGLLNPYHRAHGWLWSSTMWLGYAAWAVTAYDAWRARRAQPAMPLRARCGLWAGLVAAGLVLTVVSVPGASYGHFGELMWAKLRYLNHKPEDPGLLTFEQRIMWVPALHSATWALQRMLFPVMLYLTLPAAALIYAQSRKLPGHGWGRLLFFFFASVVAFTFFARFHVFLAFFSAALLGLAAAWAAGSRRWVGWAAALVMGSGLLVEAAHTLQHPERWGRTNVYYKEMDELAEVLAAQVAPDPVLANFGVSAYIATYGKCAIVLHPKFEDAALRQRVKEYGEQLFLGTERSFRDWADHLGVQYYVYAKGEFSRESPELQMRYFVNALQPPADAPARRFEFEPDRLDYFQLLWSNHKYALYKMLTRADEAMADRAATRAAQAFEQGRLEDAEQACAEALQIHPRHTRAIELIAHVTELRASGFRGERVEPK
jgi:MFS family permease